MKCRNKAKPHVREKLHRLPVQNPVPRQPINIEERRAVAFARYATGLLAIDASYLAYGRRAATELQ